MTEILHLNPVTCEVTQFINPVYRTSFGGLGIGASKNKYLPYENFTSDGVEKIYKSTEEIKQYIMEKLCIKDENFCDIVVDSIYNNKRQLTAKEIRNKTKKLQKKFQELKEKKKRMSNEEYFKKVQELYT